MQRWKVLFLTTSLGKNFLPSEVVGKENLSSFQYIFCHAQFNFVDLWSFSHLAQVEAAAPVVVYVLERVWWVKSRWLMALNCFWSLFNYYYTQTDKHTHKHTCSFAAAKTVIALNCFFLFFFYHSIQTDVTHTQIYTQSRTQTFQLTHKHYTGSYFKISKSWKVCSILWCNDDVIWTWFGQKSKPQPGLSQTTSRWHHHYITKSTRPSCFFETVLKI